MMGLGFLRAYHTVYDLETDRIGVIGEAISIVGPAPDDDDDPFDDWLFIGLLIAILVICCLCTICLIAYACGMC